jgi:hypothetical protein
MMKAAHRIFRNDADLKRIPIAAGAEPFSGV